MAEIRAFYEFMEIMEFMEAKFRGGFEFMESRGCHLQRHELNFPVRAPGRIAWKFNSGRKTLIWKFTRTIFQALPQARI